MKIVQAEVVATKCSQCRDRLLEQCRQLELPPATSKLIWVPREWLFHECRHLEDGLVLQFTGETEEWERSAAKEVSDDVEDDFDADELESRDRLDASKNIGYPAREDGGYGSYPAHDGFDDEAKP